MHDAFGMSRDARRRRWSHACLTLTLILILTHTRLQPEQTEEGGRQDGKPILAAGVRVQSAVARLKQLEPHGFQR